MYSLATPSEVVVQIDSVRIYDFEKLVCIAPLCGIINQSLITVEQFFTLKCIL